MLMSQRASGGECWRVHESQSDECTPPGQGSRSVFTFVVHIMAHSWQSHNCMAFTIYGELKIQAGEGLDTQLAIESIESRDF